MVVIKGVAGRTTIDSKPAERSAAVRPSAVK